MLVSDTEFLLGLSRVKCNQNYGRYSIWVCLLLISQEHCCRVRDSPDELNSSTLFHVRLMICINFLRVIHHAWEKKKQLIINNANHKTVDLLSVSLNSSSICQGDNLRKRFHKLDLIKTTYITFNTHQVIFPWLGFHTFSNTQSIHYIVFIWELLTIIY